jgi:hypothetical protein
MVDIAAFMHNTFAKARSNSPMMMSFDGGTEKPRSKAGFLNIIQMM